MSASVLSQPSATMTNDATSATVPHPSSPANEIIDLDVIPGQIGHAIVRASDGTILHLSPSGNMTERDVRIVYRMLLEIGTVLEGEGLHRVTVCFRSVSYAITLGGGDGCLYIAKKRSSP